MRLSLVRLSKRALPLLVPELSEQLHVVNGFLPQEVWTYSATEQGTSQLQASYRLRTFDTTWQFLNKVALLARKARHHPTITTTYNKVDIDLTTHDAGNKVTDKDVKLATLIHKTYAQDFHEKTPVSDAEDAAKIIDELTKRL